MKACFARFCPVAKGLGRTLICSCCISCECCLLLGRSRAFQNTWAGIGSVDSSVKQWISGNVMDDLQINECLFVALYSSIIAHVLEPAPTSQKELRTKQGISYCDVAQH